MTEFKRVLAVVAACGAVALGGASHAASPGEIESEIVTGMKNDLTALSVNLPVFLSQHLPALMAPVGIGAGAGIGDEAGGFSFGLLARVGLFNNFDDVGAGLSIMDVQPALPSLLPWPQLGVVLGVNLGSGFELGADIQFIPPMDVSGEGIDLHAELFGAALTARWRVNQASGAIPAFIIGVGGSYYGGRFEIGKGYTAPYAETMDDGTQVAGHVAITSAPGVGWSLFQISPELRVAWDIGGIFRPYIGCGVGFGFGTVSDHVNLRATATVDTVNGQAVSQAPVAYDEAVASFETKPALYALRPHVGFDLVVGIFAFTAQLDLAIMGKDKIDSNMDAAVENFLNDDPNFLYSQNARNSQTQAAAILTFATRLQF